MRGKGKHSRLSIRIVPYSLLGQIYMYVYPTKRWASQLDKDHDMTWHLVT